MLALYHQSRSIQFFRLCNVSIVNRIYCRNITDTRSSKNNNNNNNNSTQITKEDRKALKHTLKLVEDGNINEAKKITKSVSKSPVFGDCAEAIIDYYVKGDAIVPACETLIRFRKANNKSLRTTTFDKLLRYCGWRGDVETGIRVLESHPHSNRAYPVNIFLKSIADYYGPGSSIYSIYKRFKSMNVFDFDIITYNTILGGLKHTHYETKRLAASLIVDFVSLQLKPDLITYTCMISISVGQKNLKEARALLTKMEQEEIMPDVNCFNILLKGYVANMDVPSSIETLKDMKRHQITPNNTTTKYLLKLYAGSGNFIKLHELLENPSTVLDSAAFLFVFVGLTKLPSNEVDLDYYLNLMKKKDISLSHEHTPPLIRIFCAQGRLNEGIKLVWDTLENDELPNAANYTPIILSLIKEGKVTSAIELTESLLSRGIRPTDRLFLGIIKALLFVKTELSLAWLERMRKFSIPRSREFYYRLISYALRQISMDVALIMVQQMQVDNFEVDFGFFKMFVLHHEKITGCSLSEARRYILDIPIFQSFEKIQEIEIVDRL